MKFTKQEFSEKLKNKLTDDGKKKLVQSERTFNSMVERIYRRLENADDETELDDAVSEYLPDFEDVEGNIADVTVNGEAFKVEMEQEAEPEKKKVVLGQPAAASDDAEATPAANVNTANAVKAPLPGTITSIEVAVGQEVKAGDTVVDLEAMKMQNNIEAEKDGKVTAICVKPGQAVLEEDALVVIE